jgi:hypothetical protein
VKVEIICVGLTSGHNSPLGQRFNELSLGDFDSEDGKICQLYPRFA